MRQSWQSLRLAAGLLFAFSLMGCAVTKPRMTELRPPNECLHALKREADEVWQGEVDVLSEIAASSVTVHYREKTLTLTREEYVRAVQQWRTAFPDIRKELVESVVDGDTVATLYIVTGTHRGDFLGIVATGRPVKFTQMNITRCREGKLAEGWEMFNLDDLKRQMSVTP